MANPSDFDQIAAELQADPSVVRPDEAQRSVPEQPFFDAQDTLVAVPRGLADAARGVYGLADTLSFDALPDWRNNPFGQSDSVTGQLVQGAVNFAAGFIPVTGLLGKVGKIGSLVDLTKGAELAAEGAGLASKAKAISVARGLAAGAITDFAVWDGHQQRLSNLIEQVPGLENPVTAFLAAKSDDSQIVGRLKGALEGLGMGALTESFILGLKGLKAARAAREAGASAEAVNAAAESAAPQAEVQAAYLRGLAGTGAEQTPEAMAAAQAVAPETAAAQATMLEGAAGVKSELPGPSDRLILLRHLGIDEAKLNEVEATLKERVDRANEVVNTDALTIPAGIESSATNPRDLTATERLALNIKPEWMNLEHFDSPQGVLELLRTGEQLFEDAMKRDIPGLAPQKLADMTAKAVSIATDLSGAASEHAFQGRILSSLSADQKTLPVLSARVQAYNFLLEATARKHYDLIDHLHKVASGDAIGDVDKLLIDEQNSMQFLLAVQAGVKGANAEVGRALSAFKATRGGLKIPDFVLKLSDDPAQVAAKITALGGREALLKRLGQELAAWGDGGIEGVAGLHAIARGTASQRFMAMTTEYWMNAVLSGLKTSTVNFMGPMLNSVYRPIEIATGGTLQAGMAAVRGDAEYAAKQSQVVRQAVQQLLGLAQAAPEAWESVKKIGLGENGIFAPSTVLDASSRRAAITAGNAGFDSDSVAGRAVDWLGKIVRLPTAFLGSTDEFVKQMNYRSYAKARLADEAMQAGLMGADEQARYVADRMEKLIWNNQSYSSNQLWRRGIAEARAQGITSPLNIQQAAQDYVRGKVDSGEFAKLSGLSKEALDYSQDVAFTTPAEAGTVSASVQKLVAQHPFLKFVLPFVNTPMNILKFTGRRLDVIGATRGLAATVFPDYARSLSDSKNLFIRDLLSNDPKRIADATGRVAFGGSVGAYVLSKAADGTITGRGPSDPEQRKILLEAGWLPYSVRVGNGYVSYARLDPFATLVGTLADVHDYNKYSHLEDQGQIETLGKGILVALANNFTNKSYLTGLSNFVQVLQAPDRQMEKFVQRYAASFVPNLAGQSVLPAGDDNMRDVRSILDAMVAKTPGLSGTLEPQRNVLGEPIQRVTAAGADAIGQWVDTFNPVAYREVSDNPIKLEMQRLGHAFTPPKKTVNGVDLTGVTLPSGQTAYDRWSELHGSVLVGGQTLQQSLRRLINSPAYRKLSPISEGGLDSPRIGEVNGQIQEYRAAAYQQLLKEAPALRAQDQQFRTTKRQLHSGIDNRIIPQPAQ